MSPLLFTTPQPTDHPSDLIADYVFMVNLAAQQACGHWAASTSAEVIVRQLIPGPESYSLLAALPEAEEDNDSLTSSPDTWPTVAAGYAHDTDDDTAPADDNDIACAGWVMATFPKLDDTHLACLSIDVAVDYLPLPGTEELDQGHVALAEQLITVGEALARQEQRAIVTVCDHVSAEAGAGESFIRAAALKRNYTHALVEDVWCVDVQALQEQLAGLSEQGSKGSTSSASHADTFTVVDLSVLPLDNTALMNEMVALNEQFAADQPRGILPFQQAPASISRLVESDRRAKESHVQIISLGALNEQGHLVGLLTAHQVGDDAQALEISSLIVDRAHRGRGAATALAQHFVATLATKAPAATTLWATVEQDNTAVQELLRRGIATKTSTITTLFKNIADTDPDAATQ